MGNPKIHNPQNCKVKLVHLREQLKARVKFLYVRENSWFYLLASTLLSQFLLQNMSRSNTANRSRQHADHAVYVQTVQTESFLSCTCLRLKFWLTFFGSSYKIVFNISKFVIYPPAAEGQYLTFDSIGDSIDACKIIINFLCWLPITSFVINRELSDILNTLFCT